MLTLNLINTCMNAYPINSNSTTPFYSNSNVGKADLDIQLGCDLKMIRRIRFIRKSKGAVHLGS